METLTGYYVIFQNADGTFSLSDKLYPTYLDAVRSTKVFDGRTFIDIKSVSFDYDKDNKVSVMSWRADYAIAHPEICPEVEKGNIVKDASGEWVYADK